MADEAKRFGFVAILGAPNAGKSTLVNLLVGSKVSIVSRKVQTTRMRIRGVAIEGASQIVFVDTPGIFAPKRKLDEAMVDAAWAGAADADLVAVLVDAPAVAAEPNGLAAKDTARIVEGLNKADREAILVLNKVDAIQREKLLPLADALNKQGKFSDTFMVSAQTGSGTKVLLKHLATHVPAGEWAYPEEQAADIPLRLLAAEITRERIYDRLHQELPYASTVVTDQWTQKKDGSVRIDQTIFVERESQKPIVLGKGGAMVKLLGEQARKALEEMLGHRVHLFLHVKVGNWSEDPRHLREIGLEPAQPKKAAKKTNKR
ncbi:MAG: GTPase Era [Alphaproteobacteria bacterium]|nr:GTPase Era [Alphaproteobacteria bacterium]